MELRLPGGLVAIAEKISERDKWRNSGFHIRRCRYSAKRENSPMRNVALFNHARYTPSIAAVVRFNLVKPATCDAHAPDRVR